VTATCASTAFKKGSEKEKKPARGRANLGAEEERVEGEDTPAVKGSIFARVRGGTRKDKQGGFGSPERSEERKSINWNTEVWNSKGNGIPK